MIQFFSISSLITSLLSLLLGLFSYFQNKKSLLNRLWFGVSLSIALWSLALGMEVISPTYSIALVWNKLLNIGAIFIPILYYHFVITLLDVRKSRKFILFFGYIISLIFVATNIYGPYFVKGVPPKAGFNYWIDPGPIYYVFFIVFVFFILLSFYEILRTKKIIGLKKLQVKYVFLAGLIGFSGGVTDFFPQLINTYPYGNFFVSLYVFAITYSIVKHRLMNIRLIVTRSIVYVILVSIVAAILTFSVFLPVYLQMNQIHSRLLVALIASLVVVIVLDPLKHAIANITDNVFYKDKIDYQKILQLTTIAIAREIDLEKLISVIHERIQNELKIKAVDVLLKADGHYASLSATSQKKIDTTCALIDYLKTQGETIITEEFYHKTNDLADGVERSVNEQILADLERHGIELCVPVFLEGDLKALIILGQKRSGDIYSTDDVNFFKTLAPQIAVAIEKSQLYESIGEFNIKLQDKIDKATKKLRDTNLQLEEANAHLTQLDKAKSEFLSIASHQLRTPTAAIKGYLSMMLEGDFGTVPEKQKKVISDLFESASRLARLINVFLNVSRIESGRFKLDKSLVDINTLVEGVIKELQGQAKLKKLGLTFNKGKIPQAYVDGDKIREVILNLIDNAIKYSPKGEIVINTFLEGGYVHFEVHDQGIGIRPDDVPQLFHKFVRGTGVAQINTQGSGLGLYIGQRVINEHGGKIWAESQGLEKGSVFHFVVPIGEAPSTNGSNGSAKKNQSAKIKRA